MKERSNRRMGLMIAGVAVLLVLMLVAPMLKPSPSPKQQDNAPSITTGGTFTTSVNPDTSVAAAQTAAEDSAAFSLGGGEIFGLMWRLALVLIVLVACIFGLRWWSQRTAGPRSSTGFLRIIDTLPIQGGRSVHLVALGDRVIVVGATAQQLSLLAELKDEEATSILNERDQAEPQSVSAFAAQLFQSFRREDTTGTPHRSTQVIGEYE